MYVNVYTPRRRPTTGDNLEVLVHFHGGAYMVGSGHFLVNPDFIMDRDFVFVTLNYRLAALGKHGKSFLHLDVTDLIGFLV